ncbi:MAG: prepilin-type N-terminal cleavage/methylation domain-containing protein [Thermodesulfovibrionales bacterium]|nr:prepilin-type N-terminal cleavage/methylation domain-containing protein [Thermodesulfovibrionales bacterium]
MDQIIRMFGITRRNNLGFTLVELLIVIAIIGLLAGIGIPMFLGQRTKAIQSEATTNLQALFALSEQYYAEHAKYPPCINDSFSWAEYLGTYDVVESSSPLGLEDSLPGFRPGTVDDLFFSYRIMSYVDCATWRAVAIGKTGGQFDGRKFFLNQNNEMTTN